MPASKDHLMLPYLEGNLTAADKAAFESWRNESDENRRTVAEFQNIWQLTKSKETPRDFQSDQEWQKFESSLIAAKETPVRQLKPARLDWLKIAAAISLILVSSSIVYLTVFKVDELVIQTSANTLHKTLPDGSEVWLNEASRLTYREDFADDRSLQLQGEAFFDVKKNSDKPFVIQTENAVVKVLGTSFNVKAYPNEIQTEVLVVSGKVSFGAIDKGKVVTLTPGALGILRKSDDRLMTESDHDSNSLAWKDKELVFKKTPLAAVLKTLHTYFKTDIRAGNESLLHCRFTGSFKNPTLEEVFESLGLAMDIEITQQQDSYVLNGAGCKTD